MCRCWLSCWEDFYWNCIEEKFCYDETIANYNPEEDEYYQKKAGNGFLSAVKLENNNSSPVCIQPSAIGAQNSRTPTISAGKIHEDDYREIQTNGPILAPEIMAVFANSQIFHEHHPIIKKPSGVFPSVHSAKSLSSREQDSEKLLFRLEGNDIIDVTPSGAATSLRPPVPQIDVSEHSLSLSASAKQFPSIREEVEDGADDGVVLRPHLSADSLGAKSTDAASNGDPRNSTPVLNKRLRHVQSVPYFPFRPASENDIFSISGSMGQISMTPEIPSISYSTLPKHYEDTPTIEKYKESVSLYSMQAMQSARVLEQDFSMPRHFRRSAAGAQSADNLAAVVNMSPGGRDSGGSVGASVGQPAKSTGTEKSKRLKLLRTKLPPLSIHLGGNRERSKGIE